MAEPQLLTDLQLCLVDARALSIYAFAEKSHRITSGGRAVQIKDVGLVRDHNNLAQAITMRLLTPKGELSALAHPEYGCRLHELIGFPNTDNTRNLARLYVIEALKQERRIDKIDAVDVVEQPGNRHRINITLQVTPIGSDGVLDIGPLALELS